MYGMFGHPANDAADEWHEVASGRRKQHQQRKPIQEDSQSFFSTAFNDSLGSRTNGAPDPWDRADPWSHVTSAHAAQRNVRVDAARQYPEMPQRPVRQDATRANAGYMGQDNPRQRCRDTPENWGHPAPCAGGQDAQRQVQKSCPRRPPRRPVAEDRCVGSLEDRKVRVKNMPAHTTEDRIREVFNEAIPPQFVVQDAKLCRDGSGYSKGFAFVTFSDADAAVYVRQLTVVLDGKPVLIVPYESRDEVGKKALSASCGPNAGRSDLRARVDGFVNRYELPKELRELFFKCKAEPAARAVDKLESSGMLSGRRLNAAQMHDIVKKELVDAKRHELPGFVQLTADRWVQKLSLPPNIKIQVMDYFHDRSAEEVIYVIQEEGEWFERGLPRQRDPVQWLSGEVKKYVQKKVQSITENFCSKFRLDEDVAYRLSRLGEIGQRNVMKKWECAGERWEAQERLYSLLRDEENYRWSKQQQPKTSSGKAAAEKKVEYSSSEDEPDAKTKNEQDKLVLETLKKTVKKSSKMDSPLQVRSSNEMVFERSQDDIQQAEERSEKRRKKPRPTHYIICVDASGSMMLKDFHCPQSGRPIPRLDAVMDQCRAFMTEASMNSEDVYSFVTFNEEYATHFTGLPLKEAQSRLNSSRPKAEKQTLYSQGLEGVKRAMKAEGEQKPALVVFFSDGEPTDDGAFMQVLNKLCTKYASRGPGLKFYTTGCGQGDKFEHLQQMANISHGAFNHCGVSTTSIRNAFSAMSASISLSRESEQRDTLEGWKKKTSCRATGSLEQIEEDPQPQVNNIDGITFEDPRPSEIYKDPRNPRLWDHMSASRTIHGFDGRQFSRKHFADTVELAIKRQPFMKGGMRLVYGMVENKELHVKNVAKRLLKKVEGPAEVEEYHTFAKSSAVAAYFAQMFQLEMDQNGLQPKVDFRFSEVGVYSKHILNPEVDEPFQFCCEKYLPGTWVKFNNNDGYVSAELSKENEVAQAFSHFTFERSNQQMMVIDVQGVVEERPLSKDGKETILVFKLTDPQVHCSSRMKPKRRTESEVFPERFGKGDFREDGFSSFFQKHVCGKLCQDLGLRPEHHSREPTETVHIPAARDYFEDFKTWLSRAREHLEWDLNNYSGPQEFDESVYWFPVKIWAKKAKARQAAEDIQKKVQEILGKKLQRFAVADTGAKDGSAWKDQMTAWQSNFIATILPWPPGFPEAPLTEVWVIPDKASEPDEVAAVVDEVRQATQANGSSSSGWEMHVDAQYNDWYFWNKATKVAFWPQEGHSAPWFCRDAAGGRKEWVNGENHESFFQDEAKDNRRW